MPRKSWLPILAVMAAILWCSLPVRSQHTRPSADQIHRFPKFQVVVDDFPAQGWILDIGGGGEGVIGVLKGAQAIAIDIIKRELEDSPPGPLKIVMDARDLKFLDKTFNTATAFFCFMYIKDADYEKVFQEIYRVLTPGGRFLIWDGDFPPRIDPKKTVAMFELTVQLPKTKIETGYGVPWPEKGRPLSRYLDLAKAAGFKVVSSSEKGIWFFLELQK